MLRLLFPLASLLIAGLSIGIELYPRSADSKVCLSGGCRFDQIFASDSNPSTVAALVNEDPGDPGIWCTYAEFWAARGDTAKASAAFDRALSLGSGLSSVLMRVANFDFTHGRRDQGLQLVPRILSQTDSFDGILFSYLGISGQPASQLLGTAVPPTPRPAHSWLRWVRSQGTDQDILDTWAWMRQNHLTDERSAGDTASTLWDHKAYRNAQELWADWLGERRGDYRRPQLFANTRFENAPDGTPFNWKLSPSAGVEFARKEGLEVHFLGNENVEAIGVQQSTAVGSGLYRFSVDVASDNITTDEGLYFQISDAENPGRLRVETPPILGNRPRSWISADITVPAGTRVVELKLLRHPSLKFDNKIAGTLHIHQVSLLPRTRT